MSSVKKVIKSKSKVEAPKAVAPEVEAPKAEAPEVVAPEVSSSPVKKNRLSGWTDHIRENGFLGKGSEKKLLPKKGTPEYTSLRASYDAKKNKPS